MVLLQYIKINNYTISQKTNIAILQMYLYFRINKAKKLKNLY